MSKWREEWEFQNNMNHGRRIDWTIFSMDKLNEYESKLAQADEKLVEFALKIEELLNENRQMYRDGYMQGKFDKEMDEEFKY